MDIDQAAVKGEPGTGFEERGDKGPFECGNCGYFREGLCHQKIMMARSTRPKNAQGLVQVGSADCCEYVERIGSSTKARKHWVMNAPKKGTS